MKQTRDVFYAKVMLFGEYSVICDSMGLTMPYTHFTGELSFIGDEKYTDCDFALKSNKLLKEFEPYIGDLHEAGDLQCDFDIEGFRRDLKKGLYFESSIPQGYGVGSSGALVAALYTHYCKDRVNGDRQIRPEQILELKKIFAQLESFFHGTSSGIDPLNCYISFPLLIRNKENIEIVGIPRNKHGQGAIFALNTGRAGKTSPLVKYFVDRCENQRFMKKVKEEMIPLNDACIHNLVDGNTGDFFKNLKQLSQFQLDNLDPMIPSDYRKLWENGLLTDDYYLKLCGSGGGGFILGFTENYDKVRADFVRLGEEIVTVYRNPVMES